MTDKDNQITYLTLRNKALEDEILRLKKQLNDNTKHNKERCGDPYGFTGFM